MKRNIVLSLLIVFMVVAGCSKNQYPAKVKKNHRKLKACDCPKFGVIMKIEALNNTFYI